MKSEGGRQCSIVNTWRHIIISQILDSRALYKQLNLILIYLMFMLLLNHLHLKQVYSVMQQMF